MKISQGLGGPKAMEKSAADGHTVNIPSLPQALLRSDEVQYAGRLIGLAFFALGFVGGKSPKVCLIANLSVEKMFPFAGTNSAKRASKKNFVN